METILDHLAREDAQALDEPEVTAEDRIRTREYWRVAGVLAVITLSEFISVYLEFLKPILVPVLVILSAAKFVLVAQVFMHLKHDDKILSWAFIVGLIMATIIAIALLAVLHYGRGIG